MKKILITLLCSASLYAGTYMSSTAAYFKDSTVKVRVASNSTCANAGVSISDIISYITPAIDNYWNEVTTSRLKLENAKTFNTSNSLFSTGKLCVNQSSTVSCSGVSNPIPKVTDIVIACNDNTANFSIGGGSPASVLAITLPNNISGNNLLGSMILINDTPSTPFPSLTEEEKIAVIAHEIGHAVGIGHSVNDGNLMFWTPTPKRFALGPDDVDALTYLYPKRFDGCGLLGSIQDQEPPSYLPSFLLGIFFSVFLFLLLITFQKFRFKFQKSIF